MFRDLSDRLNLSRDEGEKWIVNLIRETRMGADAKIDLEKVRRVCFFWLRTRFNYPSTSYLVPKPSQTVPTEGIPELVLVWTRVIRMLGRLEAPAPSD